MFVSIWLMLICCFRWLTLLLSTFSSTKWHVCFHLFFVCVWFSLFSFTKNSAKKSWSTIVLFYYWTLKDFMTRSAKMQHNMIWDFSYLPCFFRPISFIIPRMQLIEQHWNNLGKIEFYFCFFIFWEGLNGMIYCANNEIELDWWIWLNECIDLKFFWL